MPDETGTEATRSDALSAYESLFGEMAGDKAAAVEEDSNSETDREENDSEDAEEAAIPTEDLKVVVSIKEGRATIGVKQPSSDPHIEPVDAPDLSGLVGEIPAVLERARARWEDALRYPAHARPAPSTGRQPRRAQGSAGQDSTAERGTGENQPEALRLF